MHRGIDQIGREVVQRGLKVNDCVAEAKVAVLESGWGIVLPSDYREFITRIGNGGEGPPEYGIDLLGVGPSDDKYWNFPEKYADHLRRPFRHTSVLLWDEDVPDDVTDGLLYLGNDGCGMYWVLVVTGDARGEIWQVSEDGVQPCAPKLTFLQWYDQWLDGNTDWWREYEP